MRDALRRFSRYPLESQASDQLWPVGRIAVVPVVWTGSGKNKLYETDLGEGDWLQGAVRVGGGRGFVIKTDRGRFIITAAHCLPELPDPHPWADRVYRNLVGSLGAEPKVWVDCGSVDVAVDLAVLCSPDEQSLPERADEYDEFTKAAAALRVAGLNHVPSIRTMPDGSTFQGRLEAESEARLLSLDGCWFACKARSGGCGVWVKDAVQPIRGGMSGSPILTPEGAAIGVVSVSMGIGDLDDHREGGPNPELSAHLPVWLAKACAGFGS